MKTHKNIAQLLADYEIEKQRMYNQGQEIDPDEMQFIDWYAERNTINQKQ